jgi:hypothetical protein
MLSIWTTLPEPASKDGKDAFHRVPFILGEAKDAVEHVLTMFRGARRVSKSRDSLPASPLVRRRKGRRLGPVHRCVRCQHRRGTGNEIQRMRLASSAGAHFLETKPVPAVSLIQAYMTLLRTAPNPAFKMVQSLPRLAVDRLAIHNRAGPFASLGSPCGRAGGLKSPAPPPDRPRSGEGEMCKSNRG